MARMSSRKVYTLELEEGEYRFLLLSLERAVYYLEGKTHGYSEEAASYFAEETVNFIDDLKYES